MSSAMSVYMNSTVHTQAMQAAFLTYLIGLGTA